MTTTKTVQAYHFTSTTLRDGRPVPPIGEWLTHAGPVIPGQSGLHASECPFDALQYARGPFLHRVELRGDLSYRDNKIAARERRILDTVDANGLLWRFTRWNALQVVDLWDAPPEVREYLETGNEDLRAAARAAAWVAVRAAAWVAARAAVRAAAEAAAWSAARAAAWVAVRAAVRAATEAAAWTATEAAAWTAERAELLRLVAEAFDHGPPRPGANRSS